MGSLIVRGGVWAFGEPADEAARQVELINRNLVTLAINFAAAGFTSVNDWVIPDRIQLDYFLDQVRPLKTQLVVLAPTEAACRSRKAERAEQQRWDSPAITNCSQARAKGFGDQGQWIDSSDLTTQATAEEILAHLS